MKNDGFRDIWIEVILLTKTPDRNDLHSGIVFPVIKATNKHCLSTFRRLKTYLGPKMLEGRLNDLASLNVHRSVEVDMHRVDMYKI